MQPWTLVRSHYARAIQRGDSPERIRELRAELRAARAESFLREALEADPPITAAHRAELAALLLPDGGAGA